MEKNKSILKDALNDYNQIMEAAKLNATKKLSEQFPEKFSELLKEEMKNNKKNTVKESYKKVDETKESEEDSTEENEESVMENNKKETNEVVETAGKGKPFTNEKGKKGGEDQPFDEKNKKTKGDKDEPFEEKPKSKTMNKVNEEREKDFMADLESETPNKEKDEKMKKGNAYKDKPVSPSSGKPMSDLKEDVDLTDADTNTLGSAIEGAGDDDEFITMDDIEKEIAEMEELNTNLSNLEEEENGDIMSQLGELQEKLNGIMGNLGVSEQKRNAGAQNFSARHKMGRDGGHAGMDTNLIDEKSSIADDDIEIYRKERGSKGKFQDAEQLTAEQRNRGGHQSIPGRDNGGPTSSMLDEEDFNISDEEIDAILQQDNDNMGDMEDVNETLPHTITHSNARQTGAQNHTNYGKESRLRHAMREGTDKKVHGLINENKKLIKKLNESKKYKESVSGLVESYKTALEKYRNQLKEMAVFNTNLAHVNNLLVNEELALTHDDKIKIINEFKVVNTIAASQDKYKSFINEMKQNKKTMTENFEDKMSTSIQPSSKQKLDEVVEKTAYENNDHINKMKKLIEYVENRGNKKII
ncbi:MAG: hypothetical protein ACOC22_00350 [bacterium]